MKNLKSLISIVLLSIILLNFSSCSWDDVKQIGMGLLYGEPIENEEPVQNIGDNMNETPTLIENEGNSIIKDYENCEAVFKYTVERSYVINELRDAGLTINDFPDSNAKTALFSSDGKLLKQDSSLVIVEMSVEKMSERYNTFTGAEDVNVHILDSSMSLFDEDYRYPLSDDFYCVYLETTEDITRDSESQHYYYFSLKNGDTAHFKLCFIVGNKDIENKDLKLFLGIGQKTTDKNISEEICYLPVSIEGGEK